jgi:hypothetical protein
MLQKSIDNYSFINAKFTALLNPYLRGMLSRLEYIDFVLVDLAFVIHSYEL